MEAEVSDQEGRRDADDQQHSEAEDSAFGSFFPNPEQDREPLAGAEGDAEIKPVEPVGQVSGELDLAESFRMNTRLLQYIHDSHARLVKVLERGDRSEMYIQATEALNSTFRELHASQEQLARQLERERKLSPVVAMLSIALAAAVIAVLFLLFFDDTADRIAAEVEQLAQARVYQEQSTTDGLEMQEEVAARLMGAVDRGLAANRVLLNENRAQGDEISRLQGTLSGLQSEFETAAQARERALAEADQIRKERDRLSAELAGARGELVDRDMRGNEMEKLLVAMEAGEIGTGAEPSTSTELPGSVEPDPETAAEESTFQPITDAISEPTPEPTTEPAVDDLAGDTVEIPTDPGIPAAGSGGDVQEVTPDISSDPVVRDFNTFLADAGVIDLRLLHCDGIRDGRIENAVIEIRSQEGFPIGVHDARSLELHIDPASMTASLVLEDGDTVLRGNRQAFPEGRLEIGVAAVAPGSWSLAGVAEIARIVSREASIQGEDDVVEELPVAQIPFDARPVIRRLNSTLGAEGLGVYEFFMLAGVEGGEMQDVRLHHYERGGALRKTVVAPRCRILLDDRQRTVKLLFFDGHHVTRGREVPFFKGRGDEHATWAIDVSQADVEQWRRLLAELGST